MELTATQMDLLTAAWATSRDGNGIVVTDDAIPDAHRLAEAGWLERRFEDATGELCWFWAPAADQAFEYGTLLNSTQGREN